MNIAIDVHSLGTQAGGNETYFRQLIHGLVASPEQNRYTLFYTQPAALNVCGGDPRFSFVRIPHNPITRIGFSLPYQLRHLKPDVFHCQYIQPPCSSVPTVLAIHDLAHENFPQFFHPLERLRLQKLVRWSARRADRIVTLSKFSAEDIARRYEVPLERITVTYLAASEDFHPREKDACRERLARNYGIDSPYILYVGRLQARKNLPRLVEAYARAKQRGVKEQLVLVGKKDFQFDQLLARIRELKLESSVIFPGYVAGEDLPLFYNAAELFVFPSFFEGFGLPVVESMASGLPTITSRGSSLEEVSGDAAVLVDPSDTASIADAIEQVLGNAELRRQLAERGLRQSAQYKSTALGAQLLDIYRSLCR
ncbi:MAG: glycosyltransferase family 4 protein [Acidobacteriia bacterium]|nr:glycosyltransferase family 4 protein [Terriglobia bacterium]